MSVCPVCVWACTCMPFSWMLQAWDTAYNPGTGVDHFSAQVQQRRSKPVNMRQIITRAAQSLLTNKVVTPVMPLAPGRQFSHFHCRSPAQHETVSIFNALQCQLHGARPGDTLEKGGALENQISNEVPCSGLAGPQLRPTRVLLHGDILQGQVDHLQPPAHTPPPHYCDAGSAVQDEGH